MTVVIAAITKNCIVMTADSRAMNMKNEVQNQNFKKIFHIKNGLFFGVSAAGINRNEMSQVAKWLQSVMPEDRPYTMHEMATFFAMALQRIYGNDKRKNLRLDFLFAGYGRNNLDESTEPAIFTLTSANGFSGKASSKVAVGSVKNEDIPSLESISEETDQCVKDMQHIISKISDRELGVGGNIRTVIINGIGKKKFTELIKKASAPVPLEQDKQLHPYSYSGKQTRPPKAANTSD